MEKKIIHSHELVQILGKDITFVEDMPNSAFNITGLILPQNFFWNIQKLIKKIYEK